jgi:hypothetical protein
MASVAEKLDAPEHEVADAEIVGAKIVGLKIIDGKIIEGRIVGGRVLDNQRPAKGDRVGRSNKGRFDSEILTVIGIALAMLLVYVVRF